MKTTNSIDTTGSSWMLVITLSKLGSGSSLMLSCVAITSSSFPPLPPISCKQIHFSSFFESLTDDPKVILDFFFSGEVIVSRLNLSLGVGNSMHIFS